MVEFSVCTLLKGHFLAEAYQPLFCPGLFTGHDLARGSDHEVFQNLAGRAGLGRGGSEISWVGPGRIRRVSSLTDRGQVTLTHGK